MASFDDRVSRIGILGVQDILQVLRDHSISLPASQRRRKDDILAAVKDLPLAVVETLTRKAEEEHTLVEEKLSARRKRQREVQSELRAQKRQRCLEETANSIQDFLTLPTANELQNCYREWRKATSNAALGFSVCVSCARELFSSEGQHFKLDKIPNSHRLISRHPHFAHRTTRRMLLVYEHLASDGEELGGWICSDCLHALESDKIPALSLANRMWVGPIPFEISQLTLPERMLVSLYHPRCYIYKLYPSNLWTQRPNQSTLQEKLVGNVTTYELNLPDVVRMLSGQLLPRPLDILASTIAVTYVGPGKIPQNWLKRTFRVRRAAVMAAILCFKETTRHPGYIDLDVSEDALSKLPVDDIPVEILASIRHEPDVAHAQKECESYVHNEDIG